MRGIELSQSFFFNRRFNLKNILTKSFFNIRICNLPQYIYNIECNLKSLYKIANLVCGDQTFCLKKSRKLGKRPQNSTGYSFLSWICTGQEFWGRVWLVKNFRNVHQLWASQLWSWRRLILRKNRDWPIYGRTGIDSVTS